MSIIFLQFDEIFDFGGDVWKLYVNWVVCLDFHYDERCLLFVTFICNAYLFIPFEYI